MRHKLVQHIVTAYHGWEEARSAEREAREAEREARALAHRGSRRRSGEED